ncbi:MAG: SoxR reducing system RseC family protein [Bacteroidota bacterium]
MVVRSEGKKVFVRMDVKSACDACGSKHVCMSLGGGQKEMAIETEKQFLTDDKVILTIEPKYGMLAVLLAFLVPFVLFISWLVIAITQLHFPEDISGLVAVGILVIYYVVLSLFNKKLKNKVRILIEMK